MSDSSFMKTKAVALSVILSFFSLHLPFTSAQVIFESENKPSTNTDTNKSPNTSNNPVTKTNINNSLPSSNSNNSLVSPDTKVDYSSLARYLSQGQWRRANDETRNLLLEAVGREKVGWANTEHIKTLPCWDLKTIDELWYTNSQGRFGFRVQLPIYLDTGNRPGRLIADESFNSFGDRIGWRKDNDWIIFIENLNYSIDAPAGHFPNPRPQYSITGGRLFYSAIAERITQCNIVEIKQKS